MRATGVVLAAVLLSACGTRQCKSGTVLLTLSVNASSESVDTFDVSLSVDGGTAQPATISRKPGTTSGTIEIDFAHGYKAGSKLTIAVTGLSHGAPVAFGDATQTLAPNCQALSIEVNGIGGGDGGLDGGADGGGVVKQVGQPAGPGDACVTGFIVDGYCCEGGCTGQCEACDVNPGHCIAVSGAPHGSRPQCSMGATAPCAEQTCDGTTTASCTWPATSCRMPSCTAGVATLAASCVNGSCPAMATMSCTGGICGATGCATVVDVGASLNTTCAVLSGGLVKCWGANDYGQLGQGDGNTTELHTPATVRGNSNAVQVGVGGEYFACALLADNTVKCWGENRYGQLGRNVVDSTAPYPAHGTPQPVIGPDGASPLGNVKQISVGQRHVCAILMNGQLYCWGDNEYGQIGNGIGGASQTAAAPTAVCASGTGCSTPLTAVTVAAGGLSTCATTPGNSVYCWGSNFFGQIGIPSPPQDHTVRGNPVSLGVSATQLALYYEIVCGVLSDGTGRIMCWGTENSGQLGNAQTTGAYAPNYVCSSGVGAGGCQQVSTPQENNVSQIDVGASMSCAIVGGAAHCWGANNHGQLGDGTAIVEYVPSTTAIAAGVKKLASGDNHTCAMLADGTLRCWGSDSNGQLGDGDATLADKKSPVAPAW
jgi:alpha-tubulin suppressor-like RCC1 family protein